jgi:hypothetical protein
LAFGEGGRFSGGGKNLFLVFSIRWMVGEVYCVCSGTNRFGRLEEPWTRRGVWRKRPRTKERGTGIGGWQYGPGWLLADRSGGVER